MSDQEGNKRFHSSFGCGHKPISSNHLQDCPTDGRKTVQKSCLYGSRSRATTAGTTLGTRPCAIRSSKFLVLSSWRTRRSYVDEASQTEQFDTETTCSTTRLIGDVLQDDRLDSFPVTHDTTHAIVTIPESRSYDGGTRHMAAGSLVLNYTGP